MAMLADSVEVVIGVDTHKHTHTAAVVAAATGQALANLTVAATPGGYRQLLELADQHHSQRVWAIEGTGGYGAGLTRLLHVHQEAVVELDRPKRAARRHGAKSDPLDAVRAAREVLGRDQLAQPVQLFGVGPVLAATFLGEVGDIGRFPSKHHFAAHTGTAPLEASSGQVIRHRLSRSGDRKLNHALYMMAMVQVRRPSAGQAYYQCKRAEGKSPKEALRCLKRRLSDAVYRCLLADARSPAVTG